MASGNAYDREASDIIRISWEGLEVNRMTDGQA